MWSRCADEITKLNSQCMWSLGFDPRPVPAGRPPLSRLAHIQAVLAARLWLSQPSVVEAQAMALTELIGASTGPGAVKAARRIGNS